MQDNMKCNNVSRVIEIQEEEEEKQGIENLFEKVMMENFPNLKREKVTQIQKNKESPKQDENKEVHVNTHHN